MFITGRALPNSNLNIHLPFAENCFFADCCGLCMLFGQEDRALHLIGFAIGVDCLILEIF